MDINKDIFHSIKTYDINKVISMINEIVKTKDISIDYKDETGSTALYYAASIGFSRGVELLLKAGADPNLFNEIDDRFGII